MCDGQPATGCEIMSLTEFNSKLNDQLAKLEDHFDTIIDELKLKKKPLSKSTRKIQDSLTMNLSQVYTNK